jgi:hypothetical protein
MDRRFNKQRNSMSTSWLVLSTKELVAPQIPLNQKQYSSSSAFHHPGKDNWVDTLEELIKVAASASGVDLEVSSIKMTESEAILYHTFARDRYKKPRVVYTCNVGGHTAKTYVSKVFFPADRMESRMLDHQGTRILGFVLMDYEL